MKNNNKLTPSFKKALETFNALPRKAGKGRDLTLADLVGLEEASKITGKKALALYNGSNGTPDWSKDSVFIKVKTVVELYKSLTEDGKVSLCYDELIGGWFAGDGDCDDADGEFCSTPCHDDDLPPVREFEQALEECSSNGILFVY